jgi:transcriptional regulator with XRE-family HTH domain
MEFHGTVKSDSERGPVGTWARHARLAAGYTSAEHAAEAATVAGFHVTVPYLRGIEAGTNRAGRDLLAKLGQLYGSEPPVSHPPSQVSEELLAEIREAVAEGVALGIARAFDATVSTAPQPPRRRPRRQ